MRIVCTGSRGWTDAHAIHVRFRMLPTGTEIIVGDAKGADALVAAEAKRRDMPLKVMAPDWGLFGKGAGPIRNVAMLNHSPDLVLAFWKHYSRGTRHTIAAAMKRGLPVEIHWRP